MAMKLHEFARLVRGLRKAQKRWFGGDKSSATFDECRRLEKQVDREAEAILGPPSLFSDAADDANS